MEESLKERQIKNKIRLQRRRLYMNKQELITVIGEKAGVTKKEAGNILEVVLAGLEEGIVNDGKVQLVGFGTLDIRERAARTGRNPQTGEEMQIPASKSVGFKPSKALKEKVNQ